MARGDPSGIFAPEPLERSSLEGLAASVEREMLRIAAMSEIALLRQIEFLHVEPDKPREGMVAGADGTDWDPGSGQGVYIYFAGAWNVLFSASSMVTHNGTAGKQGGSGSEFYHLTAAQHTDLTDGGEATIHHHDSRYDAAGTAAAAVSAHEAASDPHPGYLTPAEADAAYQPLDSDLTALAGLDKTNGNTIRANGSAWTAVKNELAGTTAPTANEDSGDGYSVGSRWFDTTNDKEYVCLDATLGAAVWTETTGGASGSTITVAEADGSPSVASVDTVKFDGATVTDNSDGSVTVAISASGGIDSGTSNPGSPSSGDLFFRTDLGLLIYYDGTRWLTTNQYTIAFKPQRVLNDLMSASDFRVMGAWSAWSPTYDFWIQDFLWTTFISGGTSNATNHWTISVTKKLQPNSGAAIVAPDTRADAVSTWVNHITAVNALLGTNAHGLDISTTKTGAPGNLILMGAALVGRLVIT